MANNNMQGQGITAPHEHDVLSGRGNFVNYHAGNEHFRALVRKHKLAYVACPKPQKSKYSRLIVDEIRNRNPPGRFLKQDPSTKLWYDIGEKKALDKTRQALREGAPEIMKDLTGENEDDEDSPEPLLQTDAFQQMANQGFGGAGSSDPFGVGMGNVLPGPPGQSPIISNRSHASNVSLAQQQALSGMMMQNPQIAPGLQQQLNQLSHHSSHSAHSIPHNMNQQQQQHGSLDRNSQHQMLDRNSQHQMLASGINSDIINQQAAGLALNSLGPGGSAPEPALSDMMALQNKLASMYTDFEPTPINPTLTGKMAPPATHQPYQGKVIPMAQNRRGPSQGNQLKRDDSLRFEKIFSGDGGSSGGKKKPDNHGSSAHLSTMSLSIGDMNEEDNLSSVFDSSLRISNTDEGKSNSKTKKETSSTGFTDVPSTLEMSVATFGAGLSETGNMSLATFGDQSQGNMSFSRVFEDAEK